MRWDCMRLKWATISIVSKGLKHCGSFPKNYLMVIIHQGGGGFYGFKGHVNHVIISEELCNFKGAGSGINGHWFILISLFPSIEELMQLIEENNKLKD